MLSLLAFRYIRFDQKKMFCLAQCNIVNFPHFFFSSMHFILLLGSDIRIYDVDRGWSVHKDIHTRRLRRTISDVSLSPDQRYLVSFTNISTSLPRCPYSTTLQLCFVIFH
jgi:hypothetical protein